MENLKKKLPLPFFKQINLKHNNLVSQSNQYMQTVTCTPKQKELYSVMKHRAITTESGEFIGGPQIIDDETMKEISCGTYEPD